MRFLKVIIVIYIGLSLGGCKTDKDMIPTYPKPEWAVQSSESFPYSFTAIVCLPENINNHSQDSDMVAAFINDECRGIGNLVKSDDGTKRVYFITVRAQATEEGPILFRYYNTRLSLLYQSKNSVAFEIDGTYGNYDNPIELDLELI